MVTSGTSNCHEIEKNWDQCSAPFLQSSDPKGQENGCGFGCKNPLDPIFRRQVCIFKERHCVINIKDCNVEKLGPM